ncbi:MAG: hypothetical protein E6460_12575 [Klebsiella michiganensis]|nr:hypothetical protein [Klebsiella michiganensis]
MLRLPPNGFFQIKRACDLLGIEETDILLMASQGAINIGVYFSGVRAVYITLQNVNYDDSVVTNSMFLTFDKENDDQFEYLDEITGAKYQLGLAFGLWNIDRYTITSILEDGSSNILYELGESFADLSIELSDDCGLISLDNPTPYPHPDIPGEKGTPDEIISELKKVKIGKEDLYISRSWVETIYKKIEDNTPLPTIYSRANGFNNTVDLALNKKPHGNLSRFSNNRENNLMALIFTKNKYPEDCKNENGMETNEAWAQATLDHWGFVGCGYSAPSSDHLKKIISDMGRPPSERTTAGKLRRS